jgi:hypothetical protein
MKFRQCFDKQLFVKIKYKLSADRKAYIQPICGDNKQTKKFRKKEGAPFVNNTVLLIFSSDIFTLGQIQIYQFKNDKIDIQYD